MYYKQIYVCVDVHHKFYGQHIIRSEDPNLYEAAKVFLEKNSVLRSPALFSYEGKTHTIFFEVCTHGFDIDI